MLCNSCSKLALMPLQHKCLNCPRLCSFKEEKWCNYCSVMKSICKVCGKAVKQVSNKKDVPNLTQSTNNKKHPFYGGGCKSCGGR